MPEQKELSPTVVRGGSANPERYMKCAEPFKTQDEAEQALRDFLDAVEELREKHRIANVAIVVKDSSWDIGTFMVDGFWGSEMEQETMLAFSLGRAQSDRQERIDRLMAGNPLKRRVRS